MSIRSILEGITKELLGDGKITVEPILILDFPGELDVKEYVPIERLPILITHIEPFSIILLVFSLTKTVTLVLTRPVN